MGSAGVLLDQNLTICHYGNWNDWALGSIFMLPISVPSDLNYVEFCLRQRRSRLHHAFSFDQQESGPS